MQLASIDPDSALPVPDTSVFEVEEGVRVAMLGVNAARPVERRVAAVEEKPEPAAKRPGKRKPTAAGARSRHVAAAPQGKPVQAGRAAAKRTGPDKNNVRRVIRHNQQASM